MRSLKSRLLLSSRPLAPRTPSAIASHLSGSRPTAGISVKSPLENPLQQVHGIEQCRPPAIAGGAGSALGEHPSGDAVDLLGGADTSRGLDADQSVSGIHSGRVPEPNVPKRAG